MGKEIAFYKNSRRELSDMKARPIGIFDSGLGGLSAVRELIKILPNEDIVYFGDTGRVPYGNRSNETIEKYAKQDIKFLLSMEVKMIIAACGTVSSVYGDKADKIGVPFTGVVKPTCYSAVKATKNGKIGVIGTSATIKSGSYKKEIAKLNPDIEVIQKDCPLFVPLVENGFIEADNEITCLAVKHYLERLKDAGVDTVILGCTHYPLIKAAIGKFVGEDVKLIDSGRETAKYAGSCLKELNLLNDKTCCGRYSFNVSDSTQGFSEIAGLFLGSGIDYDLKQININIF